MADYYDPNKNARENIETIQRLIGQPTFQANHSPQERMKIYSTLMALRINVNSTRGDKSTLNKAVDKQTLDQTIMLMSGSRAFQSFVIGKGEAQMISDLRSGHGGKAEDEYKKYLISCDVLPGNVPRRYMPTAKQRIEAIQDQLANEADPQSDAAIRMYAEIFKARRSVNAERRREALLDATIDPTAVQNSYNFQRSPFFRTFVRENAAAMKYACSRSRITGGHGGSGEDLFKDYVSKQPRIPSTIPSAYMPTAYDRIEALQEKLKDPDFAPSDYDKRAIYTQIFAARRVVDAKRKTPDTLKKTLDAKKLADEVAIWNRCKPFNRFMRDNMAEVTAAISSGHGGEVEDKFREYVKNLDHIGPDVPPSFMPTAFDRIEALQAKMKQPNFDDRSLEDKTKIYAEVMAARLAIEAKRGDADSLKKPLDPKKLEKEAKFWANDPTFKAFIESNPAKAKELLTARRTHGGTLDDAFRKYVNELDHLPEGLRAEYVPTGKERIEGLQRKIKADNFNDLSPEEKTAYYAELLATRHFMKDGDKVSLDKKVPIQKNAKYVELLTNSNTFKDFVQNNQEAIKAAALKKDGASVEDLFRNHVKNMYMIPEDVPSEYMPTADQRLAILKNKIKNEPNKIRRQGLYTEMMATRDAVGSVRHKKNTLTGRINAKKLNASRSELLNSPTLDKMFTEINENTLRDQATAGNGGRMEDTYRNFVKVETQRTGVLPAHVQNRYRPEPLDLSIHHRQELQRTLQLQAWNQQGEDKAKRHVATLMYLTNAARNPQVKDPKSILDNDKMEQGIAEIQSSPAFTKMIQQQGGLRQVAQKAVTSPIGLMQDYGRANEAVIQDAENQRQLQLQQQQLQQQQNLNANPNLNNQINNNQINNQINNNQINNNLINNQIPIPPQNNNNIINNNQNQINNNVINNQNVINNNNQNLINNNIQNPQIQPVVQPVVQQPVVQQGLGGPHP